MEVKIGVRNIAREITLESADSADSVSAAVDAALKNGGSLRLADDNGRVVVVPVEAIGYVEIGAPESRKVGFGAI